LATYDAGDARLRIVPDASKFREQLDTQLRAQQAEFVIKVAADAQQAQEKIDALRREQAERPIELRVHAREAEAERRIDELRAEQEARPIDLRVNVDESQYSKLSRAVDNARQQVERANEAVIASDRRVDASRRQSESAADAVVGSERRIANIRLQIETHNGKVAAAEEHLNAVRSNASANINPLLANTERALEQSRARGASAETIARLESNLARIREAMGPQTDEVTKAENALADVRRRGQVLENSLAQAIDSGVGARRRAASAEDTLAQSLENSSAARRRAEQTSRNLARTVEDENKKVRDLSGELKTLGKDFENALPVNAFADAFTSLAPLISMLPMLATGLAEVAGAAEQLGGAVLAWPGMFAGIASSFGTLMTGIHGMSDAYKALSTSAKDAGNDQVTHTREVREANEQLTSATRAQGEAEHERARAVRDSRQEMQDLNLQLRGGQLDTAQAILDAQKARQDLATGHYTNALDYQQAQLRVMQADQHVAESINSQNNLRNRGADINDRMVSANDRVTDANERVAKAVEHLSDVENKASASSRALNTAMQQLAPNAQDFVKTIFDLVHSGPLKDLQNTTQQNLFAGMSSSIRTLVNSDLPTLKTGFGSIATTMNADFKALFSSLGSDHTKGILSAIFGDTSHAQDLLKTAINPLVDAFGTLAKAGADTLPRMADGIGRAADRFKNFIDAADKDGRLDAWINAGITGFTHLGNIFINLGQSLNGITKALGGQGFLATLDDATKRLDTFLNSTKGQDDLRRIFADGRHELEQITPILENLPSIFKSAFGAATDAMGGWMPFLREASTLLKDFPGLTQGIFTGVLAWKSLSPVFSLFRGGLDLAVSGLTSVQTQITNSRVLADSEMSRTASIFKRVAGEEGVGKLTGALNSLAGLAGPIGFAAITVGMPAVEGAFAHLTKATDEARDAASQLNQQEMELEGTLDRVTGKITAQTRDQAIDAAKNFNQAGAGGGIPGISKGNALQAATSLGIAPDVYANALAGDPAAVQQVRDVLAKNNLLPELQTNANLRKDVGSAAGVGLSPQDVVNALIGAPGAVDKYKQAFVSHGQSDPTGTDLDLTRIAQQLSPSGQASVLSGLALTHQQSTTQAAQSGQQQTQQAQQGRWRLSSQGIQDLGLTQLPQGAVRADDKGYTVAVSADQMSAALQDKLKSLGVAATQLPYGQGWTFPLPKGSRDVEKYESGGGTPHAAGPLPDGGYHAVIHPSEYVANKTGRSTLGDDFLAAANQGKIDLSKLPHFDDGGPGDQAMDYYGPDMQGALSAGLGDASTQAGDYRGNELGPTGQAPQTGPQGILPAVSTAIASGAQTLSTDLNIASSMPGGAAGTPGGGGSRFTGMPGLWGLIGMDKAGPGAMQQWTNQTLGWLGGWAGKTLGGLGTDLYGMGLNAVGLGQSVLNPQNPWTQAGSNFLGGLLGKFGIGGGSLGGGSGGSGGGGLGGLFSSLLSPYAGANPAVSSVIQTGQFPPGYLNSIYNPDAAGGNIVTGGGTAPTGMVIAPNAASNAGKITGAPNVGDDIANAPAGMFHPLYTPGLNTGGYGNTKGLPDWAIQFGAQFGLAPSTYDGTGTHGEGYAMDFAPTPDNKDPVGSMDRFASFISQNLGSQTLQLIHWDPGTGDTSNRGYTGAGQHWGMAAAKPVDTQGGAFQNYYTAGDEGYGGHVDHVHWATDVPVLLNPQNMPGAVVGGTPANASTAGAVAPSGDIRSQAQQMYTTAGLPPDQWPDFDRLMQRESGYNPTAQNPKSTAYGIGQFLDSTWASVGGTKTSDPTKQLQYTLQYILQRYGTPDTAWQHELQYGWYDTGNTVPQGLTLVNNQTGSNEQAAIFRKDTWDSLQATADQHAQQMKPGPTPGPQIPDVQRMQPPARSQAPAAAAQKPGVGLGPGLGDVPVTAAQPTGPISGQPSQQAVNTLGAGPLTPGSVGSTQSGMHVLPALQTGIMSTWNTLGSLASTAISAAASAGSFGAGGAAGGAAASLVAGLFNEAGKIGVDIVNVPSSFAVSNWSGKGASPNASGAAYHPQQQPLATAHVNTTNYGGFYGHDTDDVLTELNIRDSQQQQSLMANSRAWP
jgi:hypothetical protein